MKPSGKTIAEDRGFGAATVVAGGGVSVSCRRTRSRPSQSASPRKPSRISAATARRRAICPFGGRLGGRPGFGGITLASVRLVHASQLASRCAAARASSGAFEDGPDAASAVVKRSSNVSTGTSSSASSDATNAAVSCACSPALAAQRQRQADDDPLGPLRRDELGQPRRPASEAARSTTPSGRASVPVGSETATPVRAEP